MAIPADAITRGINKLYGVSPGQEKPVDFERLKQMGRPPPMWAPGKNGIPTPGKPRARLIGESGPPVHNLPGPNRQLNLPGTSEQVPSEVPAGGYPGFQKSPAPSEGGNGSIGRFLRGTSIVGSRAPSEGGTPSLGRVVPGSPTDGVKLPGGGIGAVHIPGGPGPISKTLPYMSGTGTAQNASNGIASYAPAKGNLSTPPRGASPGMVAGATVAGNIAGRVNPFFNAMSTMTAGANKFFPGAVKSLQNMGRSAVNQFQKLNQDNTMSTPHIKTASEATPERLAAVHQYDNEQAFEMGFAKAAHDLGMNEQQYAQFYQAGLAKLAALQK